MNVFVDNYEVTVSKFTDSDVLKNGVNVGAQTSGITCQGPDGIICDDGDNRG